MPARDDEPRAAAGPDARGDEQGRGSAVEAPAKRGLAREVGFSLQSVAMAVALFAVLALGLPWLIGLVWK